MRRIVRWTAYDDDFPMEWDLGCAGGFFDRGMRWKDFLATVEDDFILYYEALRREIVARGIREGGEWHQNDPAGIPVFDDGYIMQHSLRSWGDLVAAVWAEHENRDYSYVDFAWDGLPAEPVTLEHESRKPPPLIPDT